MSREHPDPTVFIRLRKLIQAEEDRTRQYAKRVRISKGIAQELMVMEAEDWLAASNGFSNIESCKKLADDFLRQGEIAANGLSISPEVGPILEVSEETSSPDVEIIVGHPWQH